MYTVTQIGPRIRIEGNGTKINFHEWYDAVKYIKEQKLNVTNTEIIPEYYRQILFN